MIKNNLSGSTTLL